jgi:hypothetical protein
VRRYLEDGRRVAKSCVRLARLELEASGPPQDRCEFPVGRLAAFRGDERVCGMEGDRPPAAQLGAPKQSCPCPKAPLGHDLGCEEDVIKDPAVVADQDELDRRGIVTLLRGSGLYERLDLLGQEEQEFLQHFGEDGCRAKLLIADPMHCLGSRGHAAPARADVRGEASVETYGRYLHNLVLQGIRAGGLEIPRDKRTDVAM